MENPGGCLIEEASASVDDLRAIADAGQLYAILDACDAPAVLEKVLALGEQNAPMLYWGIPKRECAAYAPYLAKVDLVLLAWILKELGDGPWGIFAESKADLHILKKHFEKLLVVESPEGKELVFRFYDPRVLRMYMKTFRCSESENFFGPISGYGTIVSDHRIMFFIQK